MDYDEFMKVAWEEAKTSLKEGNNGFGAVIIRDHLCATAIVWSGIKTLAYGYSITEAIAGGRKRINLTCQELFQRANVNIKVQVGVMHDQCSLLYCIKH